MKAERRHELQTNELADFLVHGYEKHRQQLPTILWGVVAIVAVVMALTMWSSSRGNSQAQAWLEFDQVRYAEAKGRPKRLKELIERYPSSEVALWARLDLADQLCFDGREKMPLDRDIAQTYLKEAQQNYAGVMDNASARPEMIRRAVLAEAKCWELLGDRDKAITRYKAAAEKYKNIIPEVAATAAKSATELDQPAAADFYKWLADYKVPTAPTLNIPGLGPSFPPLGGDLPKEAPTSAPTAPTAAPGESSAGPESKNPATGAADRADPNVPPTTANEAPKKNEQPEESTKP
jgi:tetratricopeptide (TPR) repeat protein